MHLLFIQKHCIKETENRNGRKGSSVLKKLFEKLRTFWHKGVSFVACRIYSFFAERRDRRYGGIAVNRKHPQTHKDQGAKSTQSTDYRCLKKVFRAVPLQPDDVFVDAGCGEGRVLTWLHSCGFRGRICGIELDSEAAGIAALRCAGCENVTVICGNVLEQRELFRDATAVYLFNPFYRDVLRKFLTMLEAVCAQPVRLYYLNTVYEEELKTRERWTCLVKGEVRRIGNRPMPFTVHRLNNAKVFP